MAHELKPYKIWSMVDPDNAPLDFASSPVGLDYKTGLAVRLHPKLFFEKGELLKVEYFAEFDGQSYGDLIVIVDISYERDDNGLAVSRTTTRQWTDVDGDFGVHEKITTKYYDSRTAAREGVRRRENIVNNLLDQANDFGVLPYVQTMFRSLDNELNAYEKTGDSKVIEKIGGYSGVWLDSQVPNTDYTLRQAIMGALAI